MIEPKARSHKACRMIHTSISINQKCKGILVRPIRPNRRRTRSMRFKGMGSLTLTCPQQPMQPQPPVTFAPSAAPYNAGVPPQPMANAQLNYGLPPSQPYHNYGFDGQQQEQNGYGAGFDVFNTGNVQSQNVGGSSNFVNGGGGMYG